MESLFVYGTLQNPEVQTRFFGRVTEGSADTLTGFRKDQITIGGNTYPIAVEDSANAIAGRVLEITPEELVEIDAYEGSDYRRLRVMLQSGVETWVYCR